MALTFPDIDPVALAIGPLEIRWYALAYLAGFLLGWRYTLYLAGLDKNENSRRAPVTRAAIDDFLPWAIVGVILGGRIGYVLFYQPHLYLGDPLEALKIWHGGMSFHGGMLGVLTSMFLFTRMRKIRFLELTDLVCAAAPIGLFFGRIANFINGELFGRAATIPWAMAFPRGGDTLRHPSQLYEAGLEGLVLFVILFLLTRLPGVRRSPGFLSGAFLAGYGIARAFVEFFREPDSQLGFIARHYTMGQILCLPMIFGGILLLFYAIRSTRNQHNAHA